MNISLSTFAPENLVPRDSVPSRVSQLISILRLNLVLTYGIPPEFRGGVHLSTTSFGPSSQRFHLNVLTYLPHTAEWMPSH